MRNFIPNQLSLNLAFEPKSQYKSSKKKLFNLSEQVKKILYERGYSHIFNYADYKDFKKLSRNTLNIYRANSIAEMFIENTNENSDLNQYLI